MAYFEIKNEKTGKVIFRIGKERGEISEEQRKENSERSHREFEQARFDMESGKPSSKEGRDIFLSKIGVVEFPEFLWECFKEWFRKEPVWYSEQGHRCTPSRVRRIY